MPHQTEPNANNALGNLLQAMMPRSNVRSENTQTFFNDFRDANLNPTYLADADPNRALLDRRVICDILGFDEVTYVAVRRLAAK